MTMQAQFCLHCGEPLGPRSFRRYCNHSCRAKAFQAQRYKRTANIGKFIPLRAGIVKDAPWSEPDGI